MVDLAPDLQTPSVIPWAPLKTILDSYALVLAILYSIVTLVSCFQIFRILWHRHAVLHFQFLFLALCLVWGVLRSVFWMFLPWTTFIEMVLQGSALVLQFAIFSFLVLFYAQMIYKANGTWNSLRARAFVLYAIINFISIGSYVANLIWAYFYGTSELVQDVHAYFIAGIYLVLTVFLAVFGWKLMYLVSVLNVKIPFLRSKIQISVLTVTLCFVFLTRAVKDFLTAVHIGVLDLDEPTDEPIIVQAIIFSLYFFWEIIPAVMVIGFFWKIPSANRIPPEAVPRPYHEASLPNTPLIAKKKSVIAETPIGINSPLRYQTGTEDDELVSPLSSSQSRMIPSPDPSFRTPARTFTTFSGTFTGYNTRSPLLGTSIGSPWGDEET